MRQQRIIIAIILGLGLAASLASADAVGLPDLAKAARDAYDQGNYETAIQKYLELKKQGVENAALYYNLGNAEFKSGHIGRAVAYFRHAAALAPGDDDVRFNLEYARQVVPHPRETSGPMMQLAQKYFARPTIHGLLVLAWVVYLTGWSLMVVFILRRSSPGWAKWAGSGLILIFLFIGAWASFRIVIDHQVKWGVVVAAQAEARNGPGDSYQVGFVVPEGREVRILGQEGSWLAIGLPQEGHKGWVPRSQVWPDEE